MSGVNPLGPNNGLPPTGPILPGMGYTPSTGGVGPTEAVGQREELDRITREEEFKRLAGQSGMGFGDQAGAAEMRSPANGNIQDPTQIIDEVDVNSFEAQGFEPGAADLLLSNIRDKRQIAMLLDDLRRSSPQLDEIMRNPNLGTGLKKLLIIFGAMMIGNRKRLDKSIASAADLSDSKDGIDKELAMNRVASLTRNQTQFTDAGANSAKLLGDTLANIVRNTKSA